jgi:3'-phosphoadenosine 5'-phosphosulfate sulfotransferase (PAPS reductase)/FAD synthetase
MINTGTKYIASFSGGKDSTAMTLRLIEECWPLDEIVFFDTGWEFPEMYDHIAQFEKYTGWKVTRLHPCRPFVDEMLNHNRIEGSSRKWQAWPSINNRWCTQIKIRTIKKHVGDSMQYIGIASDESSRLLSKELSNLKKIFPLVEWGMDEKECLRYCRLHGFDWGGLYSIMPRVSCFCCPLQGVNRMRKLRHHFPELWSKMLDWDSQFRLNRGFYDYQTVHDLEQRFTVEERNRK